MHLETNLHDRIPEEDLILSEISESSRYVTGLKLNHYL